MNGEGVPDRRKLSQKRIDQKTEWRVDRKEKEARDMRTELLVRMPLEYVRQLVTGKLPTPADAERIRRAEFEEMLLEAKTAARASMLGESTEHQGLRASGEFFETALRSNQFPSVIISEDASGRFMSLILRSFLNRAHKLRAPDHANVPVLSYSVGRAASPEHAKQESERVHALLREKYPREAALICTDVIETGRSIRPLLAELGFTERPLNVVTTFPKVRRQNLKDFAVPEDAFVLAPGDLSQARYDVNPVRSIERQFDWESDTKDELVSTEVPEDRPWRLHAVEEIAEAMFGAFLERPGVKEYLAGR